MIVMITLLGMGLLFVIFRVCRLLDARAHSNPHALGVAITIGAYFTALLSLCQMTASAENITFWGFLFVGMARVIVSSLALTMRRNVAARVTYLPPFRVRAH